ncbi:zinc finger CCCH domain-containing protein 11B-like isoform X2 [Venturia canescens]|nr:zinc finger CCCH domain-containing protein 11B-like isoform X2 [Venturia canescens]
MDPVPKNNDCYFFYYSTCTKGDNCAFRHEPSALGCEVMCQYWQQGNCLNEHCNFRHMELKKNRKSIPCFWESQRGGCKKPHCPFLHTGGRAAPNPDQANQIKTAEVTSKPVTQEWSNRPDDGKYDGSGTESDQGRGSSEAGSFIGSPAVDPLIVNFDEESDSESAPSPVKAHTARVPYCKTYEEIRLEEIQAESAAYYSYEPDDYLGNAGGGKEKRITSVRAARRTVSLYSRERSAGTGTTGKPTVAPGEAEKPTDFTILTLEEIRRRKAAAQARTESSRDASSTNDNPEIRKAPQRRKRLLEEQTTVRESADFLKDAIKTLAELKATSQEDKVAPVETRKRKLENSKSDTSEDEKNKTETSCSTSSKVPKVPPVRLRRSPKRFVRSYETTTNAAMSDESINPADVQSDNTRNDEIEVRLCDSSTSDDVQTVVESSGTIAQENDVNSLINVNTEDLKLEQLCDTNLSSNDDDFLTAVDPVSEDILKDIDALLTEKSTV